MTLPATQDPRSQIAQAEADLLEAKKRLAELRQAAPREPFEDHVFTAWDGSQVRLSELFGDREDLIVIHNMGRACEYCTMWADGFNGVVDHLEDRAAFVVVSPDPPEVQQELATARGWRFRMVSAAGSPFTREAGFEDSSGPTPGVSTFHRGADGALVRVANTELGPGDDFCAVWHLFDLLDGGPRGWEPKARY